MPEFGIESVGRNSLYNLSAEVGPNSLSMSWDNDREEFEFSIFNGGPNENISFGDDPGKAQELFKFASQLAVKEADPLKIIEKMKERSK